MTNNKKQELLKKILAKKGINVTTKNIPRRSDNEPVTLSFAQEQLYFLHELEADKTTYNTPFPVEISGNLDVDILEKVIGIIIQRHEILRTNFKQVDGKLLQVIKSDVDFKLNIINLNNEPLATVKKIINLEAKKQFDLSQDNLFQVTLWQINDNCNWQIGRAHV